MILWHDHALQHLAERAYFGFIERGALLYLQEFLPYCRERFFTIQFSRHAGGPVVPTWGTPAYPMLLIDRSATTGITLLKMRLLFERQGLVKIISTVVWERGRLARQCLDAVYDARTRQVHPVSAFPVEHWQGVYALVVFDDMAFAEYLSSHLGVPLITINALQTLADLAQLRPSATDVVLHAAGLDMRRIFLPGRLLDTPAIFVARQTPYPGVDFVLDGDGQLHLNEEQMCIHTNVQGLRDFLCYVSKERKHAGDYF